MAKAIKYNYKGVPTSMKELASIFGISYTRMNNLMKENDMDPDKVEAVRGLGYAKKGKKAEKFLVNEEDYFKNDAEGIYLTVREIMNETGLSYAQVTGRIKKNIRGAALLRTAKEIAAEKKKQREQKSEMKKMAEKAKRDKVREEKRKGREALKKFKSLKVDVSTGSPVLRNPDGSKYDTVPLSNDKRKLSPSEFIEGLEKERDEYVLAQSFGGSGASQADVAELERVFGG